MSNVLIAFLLAVGASAWLYSKMMRKTGNNTGSSLIFAAITAGLLFLFAYIALGFISN